MSQPNDLSRSRVTFDHESTLVAVIELSQSSWLVAGVVPGIERHPAKKMEPDEKEIKRRADVVGIFPNDAAIVRLVGALMLEQSDEWAVSRRYFSLESLARFADIQPTQMPDVAA